MISIKTISKAWDNFFYEDVKPTCLELFRIMFGVLNVLNAISLIPDAKIWYGVQAGSTLPLSMSQALYGDFRINIFNWLAPSDVAMMLILLSYLVFSIGITIGFKSKLSSIGTFLLLISLQNRNFMILNSGDTVLKCMGFILMFAPLGSKYSIDSFLRFKKTGKRIETIKNTTIRLLQLQFSLVYLATFIFKSHGEMWLDGTATYYTSRLLSFQRVQLPYVFDHLLTIKLATWGSLFIEFALGTLIWVKELRYIVVLLGVALHIGIELTMSIGFFEWMMLISFIVYIEPKHVEFIFKKLSDNSIKYYKRLTLVAKQYIPKHPNLISLIKLEKPTE